MLSSKIINELFEGMSKFVGALVSKVVVVPHRFVPGEEAVGKITENFNVLTRALKETPLCYNLKGLDKNKVYLMKIKGSDSDADIEMIHKYFNEVWEAHGIVILPTLGIDYELMEAVEISDKIQKLQKECPHKERSEWIPFAWDARRHDGQAKFCMGCGKIMEKK